MILFSGKLIQKEDLVDEKYENSSKRLTKYEYVKKSI